MFSLKQTTQLLPQIKKTFLIYVGNLVASGISIAVLPIIARIYSPSDFGVFQLFFAWISIAAPISSLGLHEALFVSGNDKNIESNFGFYASVLLISSTFLCAIFFIINYIEFSVNFSPEVFGLFFAVLYASGIFKFYQSYCVFLEKWRAFIAAIILFSLFSNAIKLLIGMHNPGYIGLIVSVLLGYLLTVICSFRSFPRVRFLSSFSLFKKYFSDFRNLVSGGTLSQFLGAVIAWFSIFSSSFVGYSPAQIGFIAMALTLVQTPIYPLIHASYNNLVSQCSKTFDDKKVNLNEVYKNLFINLMLSTAIMTFYYIIAEYFLIEILGEAWDGIKTYIYLMLIPVLLSLIFSPAYRTQALLLGKQIYLFYIDAIYLLALLIYAVVAKIYGIDVLNYLTLLTLMLGSAHLCKFLLIHKFVKADFLC